MHSHTCLTCSKTIETGNFDCDIDADHDFAECAECAECSPSDEEQEAP